MQNQKSVSKGQVIEVLKECYDPEIPVSIYELGLIYDVAVNGSEIQIQMTLTSPHCPVAGTLPLEIEERLKRLAGVTSVSVNVVWDPPWDPSRMSDAARLELGLV